VISTMQEGLSYSIHVGGRLVFIRVPKGAKPSAYIEEVLNREDVKAALLVGLGGFREATLGVFRVNERTYEARRIKAEEGKVLEVVSLLGNTLKGPHGKYYTHIHVVVAKGPNEVYGGHLIDAVVEPFLEVAAVELVGNMREFTALLSHRWSRS